MASDSTRLVIEYSTSAGTKRTYGIKYADADVTTARVKALGQALITNASLFAEPPSEINAAYIEVKTITQYDLS